jgi:protein-disulfide isomerase
MGMIELNPQTRPKRLPQIVGWTVLSLLFIGAIIALKQEFRSSQSRGEAIAAADDMPKDEFERRVHDYLLAHPEVIGEAINRLEARERQQEAARGQAALKSHAEQVFHDPADPVGGNPSGDATVVEFFDYNCPYCKQMVPVMTQAEESDPHLRIVYKEYPILGAGSVFAARAALAANQQGKYIAFHRALYELRGPLDESKVLQLAKVAGLDVDRLKADMQAPDITDHLRKNIELAQTLGITGTPGFAVGDKVFSGATDLKSLQAMIEDARKRSATR